jgi:hypothetical protein
LLHGRQLHSRKDQQAADGRANSGFGCSAYHYSSPDSGLILKSLPDRFMAASIFAPVMNMVKMKDSRLG